MGIFTDNADEHAVFQNIDKEVWIRGATDNPRDTIFDAKQITRFFRVVGKGRLKISNILLRGGRSSQGGGALQVEPLGELTLQNCHLDDNQATGERSGGALQINANPDDVGIAFVRECTFNGNKAAAFGGGAIYNNGRVSLLSSTFAGNNAGTYGGDAFYMCGQTQLLDRVSFVQNYVSASNLNAKGDALISTQNTYSICRGETLYHHLTEFKTIGKDGTGDVEHKACDRSEELTLDEFKRYGVCVSAARGASSLKVGVMLVAVLATLVQAFFA